ncbi:MAG: ribosomal RNA large subunit methyltransferase H [Chitinophagales bacterium]|nr:MAG: ribosomal RNA large subunit methyltransferase H [Chitinophagales bacterium]
MKFELWLVGKNDPAIADAFEKYISRIKRYIAFEVKYFATGKSTTSPEHIKKEEAERILKKTDQDDFLIVLDERGQTYTSEAFARLIEQLLVRSNKRIIFIIGGSYGITRALRESSSLLLSLSPLTLSHQLARLVFAEQLYRAFTILKNEPYHH